MGGNRLMNLLFELIQVVMGTRDRLSRMPTAREWGKLYEEAVRQKIAGVLLDGLERLPENQLPPVAMKFRWIGAVQIDEACYKSHQEAAERLAKLYAEHGIKTYVLKGAVVAECYPVANHRRSVDFDCYLRSMKDEPDAWEYGNKLVEELGVEVNRNFYKNSKFTIWGLTVENHRYLTPFRGNERLKALERLLQSQFNDNGLKIKDCRFEGTELWRPPVILSALFLIEHAYSHFLHEGLTWRHVLDWQMFSRKHHKEIDWKMLEDSIDAFGFRRFYDAYCRVGQMVIGLLNEENLTISDKRLLADILSPLDLHETVNGWRGKLALAGNTWRARWKYRYYTDMTWQHALWIQMRGFLFDKNPQL